MRLPLRGDERINSPPILSGDGVWCADERYEACTGNAATSMAKQLGCGSGLPSVKQRPLLTTRPSITCGILVSSTWHGTRFTARSQVERERICAKQHKRDGSGVGKVSDANMG
jgi:hypothetical protein